MSEQPTSPELEQLEAAARWIAGRVDALVTDLRAQGLEVRRIGGVLYVSAPGSKPAAGGASRHQDARTPRAEA